MPNLKLDNENQENQQETTSNIDPLNELIEPNESIEPKQYDVKSIISLVLGASLEIDEIGFRENDSGIIEFTIDISNLNLSEDIIKKNKGAIYNHFFANAILPIIVLQNMNKFSVLIKQDMDLDSFTENFENREKFFEIKRNKHSMKFAIHLSRYTQYFFDQLKKEFSMARKIEKSK